MYGSRYRPSGENAAKYGNYNEVSKGTHVKDGVKMLYVKGTYVK